MRAPPPPYLVLALAIGGISFAGPLIRISEAHPLAIAVWRLVFSLAIVAVFLTATRQWRELQTLSRREVVVGVLAGVMLALHFWTWNTSIRMTSISASVVLVNLQPAFVALLSMLWLREAPGRWQWIGIVIALAGALIVGLGESGGPPLASRGTAMFGNALAVVGGITAAVYYTSGRRLRTSLSLWPYVALVYTSCLAALLVIAVAARVPLGGHPPREFAIFLALAVGPMMLGHTGMNYALRYLPAYVVNLTVLGEPIGATIIAALLPGIRELPTMATVAGGGLILAGIILTSERQRRSDAANGATGPNLPARGNTGAPP